MVPLALAKTRHLPGSVRAAREQRQTISRPPARIPPMTSQAAAASVTSPPADLALATRGLVKRFAQRVALAGLDLTVPKGVVYGFLGPNGAGKTTTMRLLTGLIHPDAGSIELLGQPFVRGHRQQLFNVGALVETPAFYPYLSGRQNLAALAATGAPTPAARVSDLLEIVGLTDRAGDKVSRYSLGMRQQIGRASCRERV